MIVRSSLKALLVTFACFLFGSAATAADTQTKTLVLVIGATGEAEFATNFNRQASLPAVVVLPLPCNPTIRITVGGTDACASGACFSPSSVTSSSYTTFTSCWPGRRFGASAARVCSTSAAVRAQKRTLAPSPRSASTMWRPKPWLPPVMMMLRPESFMGVRP